MFKIGFEKRKCVLVIHIVIHELAHVIHVIDVIYPKHHTISAVFPNEILWNSIEFKIKICKKWYVNPLPLA